MTGRDPDAQPPPPGERAVLAERARSLARPPPLAADDERFDTVEFFRGDARYVVDAVFAGETVPAAGLVRVPLAPAALLGAVAVRSAPTAVVDVATLLGAQPDATPPAWLVVLGGSGRAPLALAADGLPVVGVRAPADLQPASGGPLHLGRTRDGSTVLDASALLDLPPFFHDDHASAIDAEERTTR